MTSVYVETKVGPMMSRMLSLKKHLPCNDVIYMGQTDRNIWHKLRNYTQDVRGLNSDEDPDSTAQYFSYSEAPPVKNASYFNFHKPK
jgi:hypothetical protein